MVKSVVFDMDGVLLDTEALCMDVWKQLAQKHNISNIENTMRQCIGITAPETEALFLRTYGEEFPYSEYKVEASARFSAHIKEHGLPIKPGVYELFDFLKANRYRIGLASSTRKDTVCRQMDAIGLLERFEVLICGDMITHSKPHPEIYQTACRLLSVSPSACYAIEDSANGIKSAYAAGMKPIMVPDLIAPDEALLQMMYHKADSLLEVRDFLANSLQEDIG